MSNVGYIGKGDFTFFSNCTNLAPQVATLPRGVYRLQMGLRGDSGNSAVEVKLNCPATGANMMLGSPINQTGMNTDMIIPLAQDVNFTMNVGVAVGNGGWLSFCRIGDY